MTQDGLHPSRPYLSTDENHFLWGESGGGDPGTHLDTERNSYVRFQKHSSGDLEGDAVGSHIVNKLRKI